MQIFPVGNGFRVMTECGEIDWIGHDLTQEETIRKVAEFMESAKVEAANERYSELEHELRMESQRLEEAKDDLRNSILPSTNVKCPKCSESFQIGANRC